MPVVSQGLQCLGCRSRVSEQNIMLHMRVDPNKTLRKRTLLGQALLPMSDTSELGIPCGYFTFLITFP